MSAPPTAMSATPTPATPATAGVAVVRLLPGLGDLLCSVPALRALRRSWPAARITLVGLAGCEWFAERFAAYVDDVLVCRSWPGLVEIDGPVDTACLREAARRGFDVAVQMHGDGRCTNALTARLGARRWFGLGDQPVPPAGGGVVGPYRRDRHEVERCLDVVRLATGVGTDDTALEFPLTDAERRDAASRFPPGSTVGVVHPGASVPERRWDAGGFAGVARHLARHVDTVVVSGTAPERALAAAVTAASGLTGGRVVDLAGRLSLGQLAAVLARAEVLVANDTGPVHVGAALGTPTVVCGASDRLRWAPRGAPHRSVGSQAPGRWPDVGEVLAALDDVVKASAVRV